MKTEEKVAEAMLRLIKANAHCAELNDKLDQAVTTVAKADAELQRVCHAAFGSKSKQIIYNGMMWIYSGETGEVHPEVWNGIIIGNGKTSNVSEPLIKVEA